MTEEKTPTNKRKSSSSNNSLPNKRQKSDQIVQVPNENHEIELKLPSLKLHFDFNLQKLPEVKNQIDCVKYLGKKVNTYARYDIEKLYGGKKLGISNMYLQDDNFRICRSFKGDKKELVFDGKLIIATGVLFFEPNTRQLNIFSLNPNENSANYSDSIVDSISPDKGTVFIFDLETICLAKEEVIPDFFSPIFNTFPIQSRNSIKMCDGLWVSVRGIIVDIRSWGEESNSCIISIMLTDSTQVLVPNLNRSEVLLLDGRIVEATGECQIIRKGFRRLNNSSGSSSDEEVNINAEDDIYLHLLPDDIPKIVGGSFKQTERHTLTIMSKCMPIGNSQQFEWNISCLIDEFAEGRLLPFIKKLTIFFPSQQKFIDIPFPFDENIKHSGNVEEIMITAFFNPDCYNNEPIKMSYNLANISETFDFELFPAKLMSETYSTYINFINNGDEEKK